METKTFRIDWYPFNALVDMSLLKAEEIGVFMQIINLIYIVNGPIENDPKHIGKQCCLGPKRADQIINRLIHRGCVYLTCDGKISQKRCMKELSAVHERREKYSKNGEKGAGARWEAKSNQKDGYGQATAEVMARTNPRNKKQEPIPISDGLPSCGEYTGSLEFDILSHLVPEDIEEARKNAPGWDIYGLMNTYNQAIRCGARHEPDVPRNAFLAWCSKYTKGKPP